MGSITTLVKLTKSTIQMSTLSRIQQSITSKPVVMVSKSYCLYCSKAKTALKSFNLGSDMEIFEIENDPEMNQIQNYMAQQTGARSSSSLHWRSIRRRWRRGHATESVRKAGPIDY